MAMKKIVVLGGGFGGVYAAMQLERLLSPQEAEITLVSKDNYLLFTPMLHEVAAGDVSITDIVCPVRQLLRRSIFLQGEVTAIDLKRKLATVTHCSRTETDDVAYDYVIIALGSVTNFFGMSGLAERALTMKTLTDAMLLRNRMIASLEEAEFDATIGKQPLLTYVVAGAGFAGVETVSGMNDFLREAIRNYKHINADMLRIVLVDMIQTPLPEVGEELGKYAAEKLQERGVELRLGVKVSGMSDRGLEFDTGEPIRSVITVWTAGVAPNPILQNLDCKIERGKVVANDYLEVQNAEDAWAVGDCATIIDPATNKPYPPTAQHATRQGTLVAHNVAAKVKGRDADRKPFVYKSMGALAAIGRRAGVAKIMGIKLSGFIAWLMWRTIYLMKLPGLDRKCRVALAWTLDLFFKKDFVQFMELSSPLVQNAAETARVEATAGGPHGKGN